jgi:BatD DUF11 like domain
MVSWLLCCLGQQLYGQVAFSGNMPSAVANYVIRASENAADKVKGHLFIQTAVDKKSCYVGEPILLTIKLCTQLKSLSTLVKNPSFNGFSVIDMPTDDFNQYGFETIKGQLYNVFHLRKVQLYPQEAGNLQIESAVAENTIQFIKESFLLTQAGFSYSPEIIVKDMLERIDKGIAPKDAIATHQMTITSAPITINVKDYPAANKPLDFAGATGQFSIAASLPQPQLGTNEVGKLTVSISGKGNMMLLTAPDILWPQGLEAFEPTATERVSHATKPISGTKFFEYKFTATQPGTYTIPAIPFSWFDPQKGTYQTAHTQPLRMNVAQGVHHAAQPMPTVEPAREKFFNRLFANRWWVAGPVIGLILLGLFLWVRSENKKDKKAAMGQAAPPETGNPAPIEEPADPLKLAAALFDKGNSHAFYTQLNNDLKNYLAHKMQLPVVDKNALAAALDKQGISPATTIELLAVLEALEWQLYTPMSDAAQMEPLYHRSLSLVESIKYETKGHRAS